MVLGGVAPAGRRGGDALSGSHEAAGALAEFLTALHRFAAETRATFRAALDVDDPTWTRGRGWALATGLNACTCYAAVNPRVAAQTTQALAG